MSPITTDAPALDSRRAVSAPIPVAPPRIATTLASNPDNRACPANASRGQVPRPFSVDACCAPTLASAASHAPVKNARCQAGTSAALGLKRDGPVVPDRGIGLWRKREHLGDIGALSTGASR